MQSCNFKQSALESTNSKLINQGYGLEAIKQEMQHDAPECVIDM